MMRALGLALCLMLTACVAQRLAPGPGPTTPHFVDQGHWIASDGGRARQDASIWAWRGARSGHERVGRALADRPAVREVTMPPFPEPDAQHQSGYAFGLTDGRALVVLTNPHIDFEQCYVYRIGDPDLAPSPGCLERLALGYARVPSFVETLHADWYALWVPAGDLAQLTIARFTPGASVSAVRELPRGVGSCVIDVHSAKADGALYLESAVPLDPDGACTDPPAQMPERAAARLYRSVDSSPFVEMPIEVPYRGELRSIESEDVEWLDPDHGALRTRTGSQEPICHPLPKEVGIDPTQW